MTRPSLRLRSAALAVLTALAVLAAPTVSAQDVLEVSQASGFTVTGRGWGHGLGMSQWGAKGLADKGWPASRILTHYYRGTDLGSRPGPVDGGTANTIRIGLFQSSSSQRIAGNGPVELVVGGQVVATVPSGQTWSVRPTSDGRFVVLGPDGEPVGTHGSPSEGLYLQFADRGTILNLPDTGYRYNHGRVELNVYAPDDQWRLRGILTVDFERYLYGLGEVPSSWPMETLKAQAIAGRSYALEKANRLGQNRAGCNCALFATVADQAYIGYEKEAASGGDRWRRAVDDTRGQVVLFSDGGLKPIQAFYSSSSGGSTEDNEKQWGGNALPYLRGVCDPGDFAGGDNANNNWSARLDEPTVRSKLADGGHDVGVVRSIEFLEPRGVSGRVTQVIDDSRGGVRVTGTTRTARLSGDRFRSLMGLKSNLFSPALYGGIRSRWDELECAPGLPLADEHDWTGLDGSRWGRAQDFATGRLFWNASTGRVGWNYGGILARYDALREAGVDIGGPASDEIGVRGGRAVHYDRGHIYWSPATGARVTYGGILDRYLALGGPDSFLGLPARDEEDAAGGRRSRFQHGQIVWNPSSGVWLMYGGILERWEALGMAPGLPLGEERDWADLDGRWRGRAEDLQSGRLFWDASAGKVWWAYGGVLAKYDALRQAGFDAGMPTTDEIGVRGGRASYFERARIYWGPDTGARVVYGGILDKYLSDGGPDGRLGLPLSDEYSVEGGRRSDFQGGHVVWTPQAGAQITYM